MNTEDLIVTEYPEFVASRAKQLSNHTEDMLHMAVGISGEAGELLDAIKKVWVYNKTLDIENVREELGDLLFYIQGMANLIGTDLEELIKGNVEKLKKRYPTGYTDAAAQARADKKEGE